MSIRAAASFALAAAVGSLAVTAPLSAQQTRAELVDAARNEFDVAAKVDLLTRAADPAMAPPDSVWAVAVYDLAAELVEQDQDETAALLLRWAARHGTWPIDRNWYAPAVVELYDEAVPAGLPTASADEDLAATSWRWPDGFDIDASGVMETEMADPAAPVSVEVEGQGTIAPGGALSLEPGTYELVASAPGSEPVRLTREVLPGATTVLRFDLPPLLPEAVEERAANSLVRVRFTRGGQQVCTNGFVARPGGLVLTAFGPVEGASGLEILRGDDVYGDVTVAAGDADRNLAVLRFGAQGLPVLPSTTEAGSGQYVWSVHHPGCQPATTARARLASWDPSAAEAPLSVALPGDALGAPVVDRDGSLLGVAVGAERVAPVTAAAELLDRALGAVVATDEEDEQVSGGGGFPVVWVGAGAAAVGVAALLLGGGGGGGGEDTGGIIVTFPGGGP